MSNYAGGNHPNPRGKGAWADATYAAEQDAARAAKNARLKRRAAKAAASPPPRQKRAVR